MGYSCSLMALNALKAVAEKFGAGEASNEVELRGARYFFEVNRNDEPADGGISGVVIPLDRGCRNGYFRISGQGVIEHFHEINPDARAECERIAKAPGFRSARAVV